MKRYTQAVVEKMTLNDDLKPAPFPGVYPTRILVDGYIHGGKTERTFLYNGKPSWLVATEVQRIARNTHVRGRVQVWEYDRKNLVAWANLHLPYGDTTIRAHVNVALQKYYYPWHGAGTVLNQFISPFFVMSFKYKDKILQLYSPHPVMTESRLLTEKIWLHDHGL